MLYPKCLARGQHFVNLAVIKGGVRIRFSRIWVRLRVRIEFVQN